MDRDDYDTLSEYLDDIETPQDKPKPWRDEETLHRLYWDEGLAQSEIAKVFDCHTGTVHKWMKRLDIDARGEKKLSDRKPKEHIKRQIDTIRSELDELESAIEDLD